jgi:hypothetical protein
VSTVFVVWFTVTLVTTLAVVAVVIGLVRHVLGLGRTLRRFRDEVTPIAEEISVEGDRAASRAERLSARPGRARS